MKRLFTFSSLLIPITANKVEISIVSEHPFYQLFDYHRITDLTGLSNTPKWTFTSRIPSTQIAGVIGI